jgi:hypothetical protein
MKAELWWAITEERGERMNLHLSENDAWADVKSLNSVSGWQRFTVEPVSVIRDGGKLAKETKEE